MKEKLQLDIKNAMKAKEKEKLEVLRGLLADIKTAEVAPGASSPLSEAEEMAIIKRAMKRRKESIEAFRKGNREDLAEKEEKEMVYIQAYLPQELGENEARQIVKDTLAELKITDPKQQGQVIKAVLAKYPNQLEGKMVSQLVRELLSPS
jgi:uncharacterized protein YqeY